MFPHVDGITRVSAALLASRIPHGVYSTQPLDAAPRMRRLTKRQGSNRDVTHSHRPEQLRRKPVLPRSPSMPARRHHARPWRLHCGPGQVHRMWSLHARVPHGCRQVVPVEEFAHGTHSSRGLRRPSEHRLLLRRLRPVLVSGGDHRDSSRGTRPPVRRRGRGLVLQRRGPRGACRPLRSRRRDRATWPALPGHGHRRRPSLRWRCQLPSNHARCRQQAGRAGPQHLSMPL